MSTTVSYVNDTNAIFGSAAFDDPPTRAKGAAQGEEGDEQQLSETLFGEDGLDFFDLLDIINPLQHIPVISTLYRRLTGDELAAGPRVLGGALYGGPIGAASSLVNAIVEGQTGKDIGEHAAAWLVDEPNAGLVDVVQLPTEANFVTAAGQAAKPAPAAYSYRPFNPEQTAAYDLLNADQTASLLSPPETVEALAPIPAAAPPVRRAAPDLGSLGAVRRAPSLAPTPAVSTAPLPAPTVGPQASAVPAASGAIPTTAPTTVNTAATRLAETQQQANVFAAADYRDRLAEASQRRAEATVIAARPAGSLAKEGGWFSEVMTSALDKYKVGAGLGQTPPVPQVNLLN
jgi:hypothetical protein